MFKQVEMTFEGRTFQIDIRSFDHLINCGRNALHATKAELVAKPFDWDSPIVDVEFRNRREDIQFTESTIQESGHLSAWLNKRGQYAFDEQGTATGEKDTEQ